MTEIKGPLPFSEEDIKYFEEHPGEVYGELELETYVIEHDGKFTVLSYRKGAEEPPEKDENL